MITYADDRDISTTSTESKQLIRVGSISCSDFWLLISKIVPHIYSLPQAVTAPNKFQYEYTLQTTAGNKISALRLY